MNTEEWFIDGSKLPGSLPRYEFNKLFKEAKAGSKEAVEKIVKHNIRLVLYEVSKKFKNTGYDHKDLVSIGNIGLLKALNSYDLTKEIAFPTYAVRCIDNEIAMYIRNNKKHQAVESLDKAVFINSDGSEITLEEQLSDDVDITENYDKLETYRAIRRAVDNLSGRDKEIVFLYFGFDDDAVLTQRQIATKLQLSQSYVSRVIKKIVKDIGKKLESEKYIELHERPNKRKPYVRREDTNKTLLTEDVIVPNFTVQNPIKPNSFVNYQVKGAAKKTPLIKEFSPLELTDIKVLQLKYNFR